MISEFTVDEWFEQLQHGLEYRYHYGMEERWAKIEMMFYNGHPSNQGSGSNIIYSTGDAFLSTVHTPNPYILTEPRKPEQIEWAPVVETMDNDLITETKLKREMHSCGLYAYLWGTSVVKIGYDSEYGWDPRFDANGTRQPVGASLTRFAKDQTLNEFSDNRPGMPWVKACLPHDIVVPWGTRDLDSAPWIAHRIVRHVDDIKSDPKYSGKRDLEPMMSMRDFVESYITVSKPYRIGPDLLTTTTESTGQAEYVELWEIHDKRTHKVFVIATNHKKFLRGDVNHLQVRGLPFVELGFVPKGRTFWRTSDAIYLLNHQAELADITLQARKQRRLSVLKWIVRKGVFEDSELKKLMSRDIGAVAIAQAGSGSLNETVTNAPVSQANQILYQEMEDVRSSARETVGFDRNSFGEFAGRRTTAREVESVQASKDLRMGRRQGAVADAYVEVMNKINGIVFKFWTTPRVAQMIGQDGALQWAQFTPSELAGDYVLKVIFDNPSEDSIQSRQALGMQMYQASLQDPSIDPIAVRKFISRSFGNASLGGMFRQGIVNGVPPMGPGQGRGQPAGTQSSGAGRPSPAGSVR